jgi:nucleotide-binding universal stress UspA family protein
MNSFARILVPLDGSDLAEEALSIAVQLAEKFNSHVILLRVLDIPMPEMPSPYPEERWTHEAMQYTYRQAQIYLDERMQVLVDKGLSARIVLREESPAEEILLVASTEKVDLIVMTSHGMGGASLWPSGSVAAKVMQMSPCPVLLVRKEMFQLDVADTILAETELA